MNLIDTHTHIHESSYPLNADEVLERARNVGVNKLICVGTDVQSSTEALAFAGPKEGVFASIGIHPHEAAHASTDQLAGLGHDSDPKNGQKLVAIGEIGLDYFYSYSSRKLQIALLEAQLQLALDRHVPVIFHVRSGPDATKSDAFADFWPIFDNFHGLRGVLHSFTDTAGTLETALGKNLFIGVNGISTFTKDPIQQQMFDNIPLDFLLLETDAPYLTPPPFRGTVNESANVSLVASYHAKRRGISEDQIASTTTASAEALFGI